MTNSQYVFETTVPVIWLLIACVGALIRTRRVTDRVAKLEIWQRWWAVAALGCGSLWMTVSFVFIPGFMADTIGFAHSPFQFEIAFANFALFVLGLRAVKASARERITIGLGAGMFLWGATIGHVYQFIANGDHQPGNTGGVLAYDVLIPAIMIVLAVRAQAVAKAAKAVANPELIKL
jgi:hypothetical protein